MYKIALLLILPAFFACNSKQPAYNDLNDYGYHGKIKSITTAFYKDLKYQGDQPEILDTTKPVRTISNYYNADGNLTRRDVNSLSAVYRVLYTYDGKKKTGWIKTDSTGMTTEKGKITFNSDAGFSETSYDVSGTRLFQSDYTLNSEHKTKTLEDIGYRPDGTISIHHLTGFEDDAEGHVHRMSDRDILQGITNTYEFIILEKDASKNPVKLLLRRDKEPLEMRIVRIVYE